MTNNEYEAWCDNLEISSGFNVSRSCRTCGCELEKWEVDICDGCFDSEQLRA